MKMVILNCLWFSLQASRREEVLVSRWLWITLIMVRIHAR